MSSLARSASSFPTAELDRRFYAFALDRLLAWSLYAVAAWVAVIALIDEGRLVAGIALIAGAVVVVGVVSSFVLGLLGTSPGKAVVGLRVVDDATGTPIGVGPALLRTLVLGVGALPTFGFGVAALAWTAVMDTDRQRRGWHDHLTRSVVVDVRPAPPEEEAAPERPRQIVNLTAMRLVPASPTPPREVPARVRRSRWAAGPSGAASVPEAEEVPTPGPTPEITPAAPEAGPAADVAHVAPAPAAAPEADPDALRTPVTPDPPPASGVRRSAVDADTSDALAHPTGVPGASAPAAGRRVAGRHAAPDATPVPAARPRWSVSFDTGEEFVVEGFTLVGRNPEGRSGETVRRLLPLASQDMSLSKTHAQFQVVPDGALVVMDRGSTNGSLLIRGGVTRELGPGRPAALRDGDVVRFGDREMRVVREG